MSGTQSPTRIRFIAFAIAGTAFIASFLIGRDGSSPQSHPGALAAPPLDESLGSPVFASGAPDGLPPVPAADFVPPAPTPRDPGPSRPKPGPDTPPSPPPDDDEPLVDVPIDPPFHLPAIPLGAEES